MLPPRLLSEELLRLSEAYQESSKEAATVSSMKDTEWLELRKTCNSDKECDRRWGATENGKRDAYLRYYLKGLEKRMSAIRAHLRILENEARNQF